MRRIALLILIPLVLGACANKGLRDLRNVSNGPNEFMIQPNKPLETPGNYSELPPPTPGQANLTDRSALNEGVIAFGGRPEAAGGPIPASDGALVQHASRLGVAPNIREDLAARDAKFRKGKARLTQFRIVPVDRYNQVYRRQTLDANREAAKWRRAGARTPSAPPAQ
ncbi:DUF3035 domain containing protein [Sulfitobacter noctilucicola]|uniref:DUF3035 domain-containing protein n=1 Tax=Sulfitobacter noctilucicola TaxID=1342301 RepID=A0A7W6M4H7_9RHOB|nr:DUF3035 domain-containing protein [Sulfitobacter noctilucicola]KIN63181.1 DUF3035 domain containing protein [Sulfitobacter noctilucicola]MBB4172294.1 hypothetical protein [Sulfitobacter noctilucicola]